MTPSAPRHRARPTPTLAIARALAITSAASLLLAGCADEPALAFVVVPVEVGYGGQPIVDVAVVDTHGDGVRELVVARERDVHLLAQDVNQFEVVTPGSGLDAVAAVESLERLAPLDRPDARHDLLVRRGGEVTVLEDTRIASWRERSASDDERAASHAVPTRVEVDLDGDGRTERVELRDRGLVIHTADGTDVTARVGLDAFRLPAPGRRLIADDLEADGDVDLVVVGGALFVLRSNGGRLDAIAHAGFAIPSPTSRTAPAAPPAAADTWFVDGTADAGLTFTHREGDELWWITETMGPGAAFADVDADGALDLYVTGGSEQRGPLFVNDGTGRFEDRAETWGLTARGAGMGASFADWDDDGDPDLYVTNDGPNVMWRHDGERFTDVTGAAGTGDDRWGASCAWADVDADGDLDLYVTNYLAFDADAAPPESEVASFRREDPITMLPYVFPGQPNVLYLNEGDGRFRDATTDSGLHHPDGKSLGALFLDQDADGHPDLYVANDTTPNTLWHNRGDGTFEEIALFVGLDDPRGGMGVAASDLDRDGDEDVLVTYWQVEPNALYRNNRVHAATERRFIPRFEDVSLAAGLARESVGYVGWGCLFADLDNDGDDDLFVANGYTSPDYETTMICVGQPDQLFENESATTFERHRDVPRFALVPLERAGAPFADAHSSRAAAAGDVDGDGDVDVVVTNNNGPLVLYRNESGGRSLRVRPVGGLGCPRDAPGAIVTLGTDDGRERSAVARLGGSYLAGHEPGVRFGLGDADPERVHVRFPCGREVVVTDGFPSDPGESLVVVEG